MIGKVGLGNYAKGILEYCYYEKGNLSEKQRDKLSEKDVRGDMVYIQNLGIDFKSDGRLNIDYLAKQFNDNTDKNKKLNKNIWHQTFSFPPEEKLKNEVIQNICKKFSKDFGFENNQMIAFIHKDTAHQHFHIVANRVSANGKNTADHFNNYKRTGEFCRKIELELGLQITPNMGHDKQRKGENKKQGTFKDDLLLLVTDALKRESQFNNFTRTLKKHGVQCDIGRGITFINVDTEEKIKGSEINREFSLSKIQQHFKNKEQEQSRDRGIGLSL